jgi:hypothetical protein
MNRFPTMTASSCLIIVLVAGTLFAGPLDRQNVQPRTNPVTHSMIRVPGVVGQEQMPAMAAIQQAGLNPSILEAGEIPKDMGGAAGMEGKVVSQTPTAGGMAMYGTTVTLYVWKPNQGAASTGTSTDSYPLSYSTQPTFTNPQTTFPVQQQMMPQGGGFGSQMQQPSQPFQVQKYYYPSAPGTPTSTPQGQTSTTPPPPMDPYGNPQGGASQGGQPMQQMAPSPP